MMFFYYFIKKNIIFLSLEISKKIEIKVSEKVFNLNQIFLLTFFYIYVNI